MKCVTCQRFFNDSHSQLLNTLYYCKENKVRIPKHMFLYITVIHYHLTYQVVVTVVIGILTMKIISTDIWASTNLRKDYWHWRVSELQLFIYNFTKELSVNVFLNTILRE